MLKRKKTLAVLVCMMFLFSCTSAFAAVENGSVYNTDGKLFASGNKMNASSLLRNQVNAQQSQFLYGFNGKYYNMRDAFGAFQDVAGDMDQFGAAIEKKTPVEVGSDEFKVINISAVDANTLSVKFTGEGAPEEAVEVSLDTALEDGQREVTFTYNEVEYTGTLDEAWVAPVEGELAVVEVSAINANYVTVAITAPEEDLLAQEVEVKNGAGVVVPVKSLDIAAGDEIAEFEFVTAVKAADLKGVWTVNGKPYDLDLLNKLSAFLGATDQLKLNAALVALGIDNVDTANMPAYFTAQQAVTKTADELTVADVQKLVDDVNADAISAEDEAAIVKAVVDAQKAGNDVALLQALQNKAFVRVNPEWMTVAPNGYVTTLSAVTIADTINSIQTIINTSNDDQIKVEVATDVTGIDKTKLNDAQALIDAYGTVDKDGKLTETTVKTYPAKIKEQLAVADVVAATTPTALKAKLTALATLVDSPTTLDMKNYLDVNGKAYLTELAKSTTTTATAINTVLTTVNTAEATALVNAVKAEATATPVNADKLLTALNNLGLKQVATSNKDAYAAEADFKTIADKTAGQTAVGKVNVAVLSTMTDADKLLTALKVLELDNIIDANKDAYLAGKAEFTTDAAIVKTAVGVINTTQKTAAQIKAINEATTAAEVKAALDKLAIVSYVDVPTVDKLYIAEQVFAAVKVAQEDGNNTLYADNTALTAALFTSGSLDTGIVVDYTALVGEFASTKIVGKTNSAVIDQLDKLDYEAFENSDKPAVAEYFRENYPVDGSGTAIDFATLTAVKAAIDAAIAAI